MKHYVLGAGICSLAFSLTATAQTQPANAPAATPAALEIVKPKWESSAAAGLTLTRGNSRTILATANIASQRKWADQEILLGGDAAYGANKGVEDTETLHGFAQYNRLFASRWYYGVKLEGLHDGIADIRYRFTLAPLVGYFFIKETNTSLKGEVGPAFVYQNLGGDSKGFMTLRAGERFEHKFSDRAKMWQSFEILPQVDDFNNFFINAEIGADAGLTEKVSLTAYIQDTYYNVPAPGRQKNDIKLVSGIKYKF
jgi:putative salt-induced outer membrane protein YdiY